VDQCEYATDIVFRMQTDPQAIYDNLARTAIHTVKPENTATFLGRKLSPKFERRSVVSAMSASAHGFHSGSSIDFSSHTLAKLTNGSSIEDACLVGQQTRQAYPETP
jgi:hypothetical protein